jgi:hypothetical protein
MGTDQNWTEFLRCGHCGKTGVAELSAGTGPYDDQADFVPPGFKVVPLKYGIGFLCVGCNIPVKP